MQHTGQRLQRSSGFLLQFFPEIIGQEEVVHIPLIAKGILVVRTNGCI